MSNDGKMSDKDRFDAYLQLANYWANSYQERRDVEWKVGLGLWAVILTALITKDLPKAPYPGLGLIIVWLIYVFVWLIPILLKNRHDKSLSRQHAADGGKLLPKSVESKNEKSLLLQAYSQAYSLLFHALTTGLLLLALYYKLAHSGS